MRSPSLSTLVSPTHAFTAIDVFNHMSNAGIECDAVTCCSLITALDKGGQWQLAEQVSGFRNFVAEEVFFFLP